MNSVVLIGRLTRDPELRYTTSQMAVATFSLAIDRPVRAGKERETDFPRVTVFGKQAENCEKYLAKGRMAAVQGRLQTGSYTNKDGATVYTTDVVADRVRKKESVLGDDAHFATQGLEGPIADVFPVYKHSALGGVIKTGDQIDQSGFA